MALVTLELFFPTNWACEGSVDLLYVDGASGVESSYGTLAQGGSLRQETYEGHRWNLREIASRELLMSLVAEAPAAGGPQVVQVGAQHLDPIKEACWRMGQAPREPLIKATGLLLKILGNVVNNPAEPKFRSIKASNSSLQAASELPGVLALLLASGFEEQIVETEPRFVLRPDHTLMPVQVPWRRVVDERSLSPSPHAHPPSPPYPRQDAIAQMRRLDALLRGLPPPGESLSSMNAAAASARAASSSTSTQPSHRCAACRGGINNDLRAALRGSGEVGGWRTHDHVGQGEYRFHCARCNVDLCAKCYDAWKGGAAVHSHDCHLSIEAPITTLWGGSSYGPPPAPPPVTSRNRRGPWG